MRARRVGVSQPGLAEMMRTTGSVEARGARGRATIQVSSRHVPDQLNETIRETRTCPKCSSEHFKDRRDRTA